MSQVIVVKDLSNLGEQLKAALAGSGIDSSQFGDIGVQIQKALADAGLGPQIVSGVVDAPPAPVVEPEGPLFGELLDTEDDETEFNAFYSVKNAARTGEGPPCAGGDDLLQIVVVDIARRVQPHV